MRYLDVFSPNRLSEATLWPEFDQFFSDFTTEDKHWLVPAEVSESDEAYHISFDVPGVNKDDLKIEVHGTTLTVSGERKRETFENRRTRTVRARRFGHFSQSFTLPESIDNPKIDAKYADGVLEVTVPKGEAAKPRQISVR